MYDGFDIDLSIDGDEKEIIEEVNKKGVSHASQVMKNAFEDIKYLTLDEVVEKYDLDETIPTDQELITSLKFFQKALNR